MTAPKVMPDFRPLERSAKVLGYLIDDAENIGFGLDDIELSSLRTGISALQLVPELYAALELAARCLDPRHYTDAIGQIDAALAKARGEG